jgi:hypothetical protein
MKNFKRQLIALSVALVVMGGVDSSFANTEKDKADDSVYEWGPWGMLQTAAGPGSVVSPLSISFADGNNVNDGSQFDPSIQPQDGGAQYREYMAWYSRQAHADERKYERAYFIQRQLGNDGPEGAPSYYFNVGTDAGQQQYAPDSLLLREPSVSDQLYIGRSDRYGAGQNGKRGDMGYGDSGHHGPKGRYQDVEMFRYSAVFDALDREQAEAQADIAFIQGQWADIQNRRRWGDWHLNRVNDVGFFIAGNSSTLSSINNLIAGDVEASYQGGFMTNLYHQGFVNLNVDFGAKAWSGKFMTPTSNKGVPIYFEVNDGVMNGVDLLADVKHVDKGGDVSGIVEASFFGRDTQYVNGVADVVRDSIFDPLDRQYVGVFSAEAVPR